MRRLVVYLTAVFLVLTTTARPRAASGDIVLYATDASNLQGNWSRVADSSAAGGQMLVGQDRGWSSTDNALASPPDSFDFVFTANANTPYRVWVRLRATGNSKFNDSLFAQFSDAQTTGGSAIYRIGTTSGLTLNLQSCNGCALAGWGWLDGAYWLSQATTITFASSGSHMLRIQTREDGVALDQVVLSPSAYLSSAPGQAMNDATIIAKGATTTSTGSTPYLGSPAAIPGTVLAQNFDNGGEGVAYHDTTTGNSGGAYRQTGVDLEPSSDGGNDVGWISAGEWLNYSVNVATAGSYTVTFRVASSGQGGTFHLEMNGANVTGSMTIPNTGDWQSWTSLTKNVTLGAGAQIARLVMDSAGPGGSVGNINWMRFASGAGGTGGGGTSTPFSGSAIVLPGTVDAGKFDNGGEGVAYHDATSGNSGGAFRSTDVDLETSSDGGTDIGWISAGEWVNYTVNVAAAGSYTAQLRVASPSGGALHVGFNGPSSVWSAVSVPATGDWQAWTTVSIPVTLGAGTQQLTLLFDTAGFNVRSVNVTSGGSGGGGGSQPPPSGSGNTINVGAGGNLQAAIDSAQPGDTILLTPGATYRGIFNLPVKGGSSYITIRSSAPDSSLPGDGVRMTPQYAAQLPRIQGGVAGAPAFTTSPGAHHYRLLFLDISSTYAANQIVELGSDGSGQNSMGEVPHDLVIDRCYIHGDPANGQKRGIALNTASTWIVNSYISDIKSSQEDSQAIAGWNGPGPYTIENNYLEAAGENILFGGGDPAIANLIASDISIRFNTITKRPSWRGSAWTVKNLIELKNAQRVVIDGNVIEYCWAAAQSGYAIVLTPRNQDGNAPWSVVQHVQFTNNIVRHVSSGFSIAALDDGRTTTVTNDIVVRNNLFEDVSKANWGGAAQLVLTQGGNNIVFDHNTVFTDGSSVVYADVTTVTGFVFTNNIIPDNAWAVMGGNAGEGIGTLSLYYPGATFRNNAIIGASAATYPANNFFPATASQIGFVDLSGGNYRLSASSPYKSRGSDGLDIGVNVAALRP